MVFSSSNPGPQARGAASDPRVRVRGASFRLRELHGARGRLRAGLVDSRTLPVRGRLLAGLLLARRLGVRVHAETD